MHARMATRLVTGLVVVTSLSFVAVCGSSSSSPTTSVRASTSAIAPSEKATYEYVVPYGTSVRIDQGQVVDIMPLQLDVKVGQSIRIWNKDGRDYMIGPFYVAAGQQLAMRFTQPGKLSGVCTMNPEGEFIINVTA